MSNKKMDELVTYIWKLADALKSVMYVRNIPYAVTRLMFLKYALDNCICATTLEAMQSYVDAQKKLALRDVDEGLDAIFPVMQLIDQEYGLGVLLSSGSNIAEYGLALFGGDYVSKKKNLSEDSFKGVIGALSQIDLTEGGEDGTLGRMLADTLIQMIMQYMTKDSFRAEISTNHKLNSIAKEVLAVEETDIFCDFASGIGISTIDITGETRPMVKLAEINESVAALSAMLMIMYGYKEIGIKCIDTLVYAEASIYGNKLFVDPPIGVKVKDKHDSVYTDSTLIAIDMAVNCHLKDGGMAVIPVPGKFLFAHDRQTVQAREDLIKRGFLRAVVSLPPMWKGTNISTNLLVIEKKFQHDFVFINAFKNKTKDLSSDEITEIVNTIKQPKNVDGFSYVTTVNEVIARDYELLPAKYIPEEKDQQEGMTLEEIDAELSNLYGQLLGGRNA